MDRHFASAVGPAGARQILTELKAAFPDFKIATQEVLQDGDKVIVHSEIARTHRTTLMGFPPKNRRMPIQSIDIHENKDGNICANLTYGRLADRVAPVGVFEK